jgi:hypothetical protein
MIPDSYNVVECALKSLFRMSSHRAIATYLFPTLTQSRKLLLHFRFLAQSFVASLSGYIFDTAIGGNFDPFLARLSAENEKAHGFSDVFEVAERHSALLDDILSACLLRSGQRGIGDVLRHCLELVLEFTIVVGELHRERVQEYQAASMIEDIFKRFCKKMIILVRFRVPQLGMLLMLLSRLRSLRVLLIGRHHRSLR